MNFDQHSTNDFGTLYNAIHRFELHRSPKTSSKVKYTSDEGDFVGISGLRALPHELPLYNELKGRNYGKEYDCLGKRCQQTYYAGVPVDLTSDMGNVVEFDESSSATFRDSSLFSNLPSGYSNGKLALSPDVDFYSPKRSDYLNTLTPAWGKRNFRYTSWHLHNN